MALPRRNVSKVNWFTRKTVVTGRRGREELAGEISVLSINSRESVVSQKMTL